MSDLDIPMELTYPQNQVTYDYSQNASTTVNKWVCEVCRTIIMKESTPKIMKEFTKHRKTF